MMTPARATAQRRQLETLLDTARHGGRELDADPIKEPYLLREFGVMRFFKTTYGFVMRKALHLNPGRTAVEDTVAGTADSRSLFLGKDDLAEGVPDPDKGSLMVYGLLPPGNRLVLYGARLFRPHSQKLKAIGVEPAVVLGPGEYSFLTPAQLRECAPVPQDAPTGTGALIPANTICAPLRLLAGTLSGEGEGVPHAPGVHQPAPFRASLLLPTLFPHLPGPLPQLSLLH